MNNALVTGVSSGIGFELAKALLKRGFNVYGVSRRVPKEIIRHVNFHFLSADLSNINGLSDILVDFFINKHKALDKIMYVFLNAGEFNKRLAPVIDVPLSEYVSLMNINVWSNKVIIDFLLRSNISINTVIFSSSISSLRARKGMGSYAISKAALNMMAKLYSLEHPEIFFSVLGLCNVNTFIADNILQLPLLGNFDELRELRERAKSSDYLVSPYERAEQILLLLESDLKIKTTSGDFFEIRHLLNGVVEEA